MCVRIGEGNEGGKVVTLYPLIIEIDEENWAEWFVKALAIGNSDVKRYRCQDCGINVFILNKKVDGVRCPNCGAREWDGMKMIPKLEDFVEYTYEY